MTLPSCEVYLLQQAIDARQLDHLLDVDLRLELVHGNLNSCVVSLEPSETILAAGRLKAATAAVLQKKVPHVRAVAEVKVSSCLNPAGQLFAPFLSAKLRLVLGIGLVVITRVLIELFQGLLFVRKALELRDS